CARSRRARSDCQAARSTRTTSAQSSRSARLELVTVSAHLALIARVSRRASPPVAAHVAPGPLMPCRSPARSGFRRSPFRSSPPGRPGSCHGGPPNRRPGRPPYGPPRRQLTRGDPWGGGLRSSSSRRTLRAPPRAGRGEVLRTAFFLPSLHGTGPTGPHRRGDGAPCASRRTTRPGWRGIRDGRNGSRLEGRAGGFERPRAAELARAGAISRDPCAGGGPGLPSPRPAFLTRIGARGGVTLWQGRTRGPAVTTRRASFLGPAHGGDGTGGPVIPSRFHPDRP